MLSLIHIFHVDVLALDARGEYRAVAVVNRTALGVERLAYHAARIRLGEVAVGVEDLVIGKARRDEQTGEPQTAHEKAVARDVLMRQVGMKQIGLDAGVSMVA